MLLSLKIIYDIIQCIKFILIWWGPCCSIFSCICSVLQVVVCPVSLGHCVVCPSRFTYSDCPFGIFKLFLHKAGLSLLSLLKY